MLTSHEKTVNFVFFFTELLAICDKINVLFKPDYIMTDACHAMTNSIRTLFPDCKILMCWFHLKQNIRKHKVKILPQFYDEVMHDINDLHRCSCSGSFKVLNLFDFFNLKKYSK